MPLICEPFPRRPPRVNMATNGRTGQINVLLEIDYDYSPVQLRQPVFSVCPTGEYLYRGVYIYNTILLHCHSLFEKYSSCRHFAFSNISCLFSITIRFFFNPNTVYCVVILYNVSTYLKKCTSSSSSSCKYALFIVLYLLIEGYSTQTRSHSYKIEDMLSEIVSQINQAV